MTTVSRRSLAKGTAWVAPAILASATVPAYAASLCNPTQGSWYAKSRIVYTDPDYSNANFDNTVTLADSPRGESSIQHWVSNGDTLNWRIPLGLPDGAAAGLTITIPIDPSWGNPTTPGTFNLSRFKIFGAANPDLYSKELPAATVTVTSTEIVIYFPTAIEPGSAGGFSFAAKAVGGAEAVRAGTHYTAEAFYSLYSYDCPPL